MMQQHSNVLSRSSSRSGLDATRRKTDIVYHVSMLSVLLFFLLLPPLSHWCHRLGVDIFQCPYQQMTGEGCPFCGTTTQLWHLSHGRVCISIPVLVMLVAYTSAVFRHSVWLLLLWLRRVQSLSPRARLWDIIASCVGVIALMAVYYAAWFMPDSAFAAYRLTL